MKSRPPIEHDLKTWPEVFLAIFAGMKPWEYRKNDRDFRIGDSLLLREWDPKTQTYTGKAFQRYIIWLLSGGFGIPDGYCIMTLSETK